MVIEIKIKVLVWSTDDFIVDLLIETSFEKFSSAAYVP